MRSPGRFEVGIPLRGLRTTIYGAASVVSSLVVLCEQIIIISLLVARQTRGYKYKYECVVYTYILYTRTCAFYIFYAHGFFLRTEI